jgi:tubulin-specific chaperone D
VLKELSSSSKLVNKIGYA